MIAMQDLSFRSGAPIFGPDKGDANAHISGQIDSNRSKRNGPSSIKALNIGRYMTRYKC